MVYTIADILSELETWLPLTKEEKKRATRSNITTANNIDFKYYVNRYIDGDYDNDIEVLQQEIISLLD
jgi:hypothetical protein